MRHPISRRSFLLRSAAGGGAAVAGAAASVVSTADSAAGAAPTAGPFYGAWQQGVLSGSMSSSAIVSLDVMVSSRSELEGLLRTLTAQLADLYRGGPATEAFSAGIAPDDGILGPNVPSRQLVSTVSVSSSLFDQRFGLGRLKPSRLEAMTPFPNDNLQPALCGGDISLLLQADSRDTVVHALRRIMQATDGGWQTRWRVDGFSSTPRPSGKPRNLFGFNDGIANPDVGSSSQVEALVWAATDGTEPAWTRNGSYQVIRVIRQLVEFWDRVSVQEQERMIGRRRDNGAVLGADTPSAVPDYRADPSGVTVPLSAHIRLANPRTPSTEGQRILRRAFNYDLGIDENGNLNQGLLFVCYQQDPKRQFVEVQTRLIGEPMVDYISPVGGGYFFTLPGVGPGEYLGQGLLNSTM